jgi:hypothetical protein
MCQVNLIQAAQTKLPVAKARIYLWVYMLGVKFLNEKSSACPSERFRKQVSDLCLAEIALVTNQRDVGKQEAERTLPMLSTLASLHLTFRIRSVFEALAVSPAAQIFAPEVRLEQEAWQRFDENAPYRPNKMQVHFFRGDNFSPRQELVCKPEPTLDPS